MIYSYQECLEKYGTDYKIKKEIKERKLFQKEKGVYSDQRYVSELEIITLKYPKAIFTLNSAFYYYGFTDTIPSYYYLATPKNTQKIRDIRVRQIYENSEEFDLGKTTLKYEGVSISIYDRERLLIELIRNKNKMPFDLYKELVLSFRKIIDELDMGKVADYSYVLPKTNFVMQTLRLEIL